MERSKKTSISKKVIMLLWIAFIVYSIISTWLRIDNMLIKDYSEVSRYVSLDDGWEIEMNGSVYQDVSLENFQFAPAKKGDRIVMQKVIPEDWDIIEPALRIHIRQSAVKMYIDNQLIYEYGYDRIKQNKTVGSGFQFVNFSDQYKGKKLKIELYVTEKHAFSRFESVRIYEWENAYRALVTDNRMPMFLGSFLTIFGLVILIITSFAVILSPKYIKIFCIAIFSICVGLWTLCYYNVVLVYSIPLYSVTLVEYMTLYMSPLPLLIYLYENVKNLEKKGLRIIYWILFVVLFGFDVVAFALHAKDIVHFAAVLKYWQGLIVIALLYFTVVLIKNLKYSKKISRLYLIGMLIIFGCVGYDMIRYYAERFLGHNYLTIKGVSSIGVLIFIFILIFTFYINVTEKMMQEKERDFLIKSAYTDDLTQLSNRRYCSEYMKKIDEEEIPDYAVVCFDLNNLKVTNDTYGHVKGDILIKSAAEVISGVFGAYGVVGRMGGDEFIAIIDSSDQEEIDHLVEEFLGNMERKNKEDTELGLSIAYGYALSYEMEEKNIEKIYRIADNRMYENKRNVKGM